jgi:nucleotide-binding universal stress UspA family protein
MSKKNAKGEALVAFDGSASSIAALTWAAENAPLLNLEIEVVNVWEYVESALDVAGVGFGSGGYVGESDPALWSKQILKEGVAGVFGAEAEAIKTRSVEGGIVRTLVELSREADLLIMGSRGHGKFADLILGSISASCSAKSKCPVVIVHAPA